MMTDRRPVVVALALLMLALPARAEDLMQVYREAQQHDPVLAGARATWTATQERVPQARAGLLPTLNLSGTVLGNAVRNEVRTNPPIIGSDQFATYGATISAAQPIVRMQNVAVLREAEQQVTQADYVLDAARQDLIVRVAQAYFEVLLAQFTVELSESQKAAVSEQLAQAKRNFEVGVATITDTNEAQARYDTITAQEIAASNDFDNKRAALRTLIGRMPGELKRLGPGFEPVLPEPNDSEAWIQRALDENFSVRIARTNVAIADLEVERARAAHYPTLDAVATWNQNGATAGVSASGIVSDVELRGRSATLGLQLAVPLYQGGAIQSRVREAIALRDRSRQDLETTRRNAAFLAQTGFAGVTSAAASVKAFEQALVSAQTALESNRLGLEVGVRTTLDVLTVQQTVFQTRRDLAQAYFNYLVGVLRLKNAAGVLTDADLEELNRRLQG